MAWHGTGLPFLQDSVLRHVQPNATMLSVEHRPRTTASFAGADSVGAKGRRQEVDLTTNWTRARLATLAGS